MFSTNNSSGDSIILNGIQSRLLKEFPNEVLYGIEFGVAYGGGIEQICKLWKNRGLVVGYDTFTSHPKHLASNDIEKTIMDGYYNKMGKNTLSKEHIQNTLISKDIFNFILIQEEVTSKTTLDLPFKFHYVLLDFDIAICMNDAYNLIKNKIKTGGYICVHDIIPENHIPSLNKWWFNEILPSTNLTFIDNGTYLGIYRV